MVAARCNGRLAFYHGPSNFARVIATTGPDAIKPPVPIESPNSISHVERKAQRRRLRFRRWFSGALAVGFEANVRARVKRYGRRRNRSPSGEGLFFI